MTARQIVLVVSAALLLAAMPVLAHHSFKAEYDDNRPVTLNGTVTKVTWKNPHVLLYLDVKDEAGKVTNWQLELNSPNVLISQGWKLDSLKVGDQVTANGFPAKNGENVASIRKITVAGH
jgi:Family of unknown function (DUF6152)